MTQECKRRHAELLDKKMKLESALELAVAYELSAIQLLRQKIAECNAELNKFAKGLQTVHKP